MIEKCQCAKCGTAVRVWEHWRDDASGEHVYRVYCHGEVDVCRIDWRRFRPDEVLDIVAFRPLQLPGAGQPT
jgi:hypothetical protein